jgi:hypothetical protein
LLKLLSGSETGNFKEGMHQWNLSVASLGSHFSGRFTQLKSKDLSHLIGTTTFKRAATTLEMELGFCPGSPHSGTGFHTLTSHEKSTEYSGIFAIS